MMQNHNRYDCPANGRRHFLGALLALGLAATLQPAGASAANGGQAVSEGKKPLVLYYSQTGNTQKVAEEIHRLVGGDILRIEPAKPYPDDYDTLVALAKEEQKNNARPAVRTAMPDFGKYSIIFLGFPNWWSSMPMPMFTFLEKAGLKGMSIAPFDTNGGGGMGHSVEDIRKLLPDCVVLKALAINGRDAGSQEAAAAIRSWLAGMGLAVR